MTCPYCQSENKVRKEAEHIICYNCTNSFSIENPTIKCISSKKQPITIPNKCVRVSDMYFPDPMFFPGRYPYKPMPQMEQHEILNEQRYGPPVIDRLENEKMQKQIQTPIVNRQKEQVQQQQQQQQPMKNVSAIEMYLNDMGDIDFRRNKKWNRNLSAANSGNGNIIRNNSSVNQYNDEFIRNKLISNEVSETYKEPQLPIRNAPQSYSNTKRQTPLVKEHFNQQPSQFIYNQKYQPLPNSPKTPQIQKAPPIQQSYRNAFPTNKSNSNRNEAIYKLMFSNWNDSYKIK